MGEMLELDLFLTDYVHHSLGANGVEDETTALLLETMEFALDSRTLLFGMIVFTLYASDPVLYQAQVIFFCGFFFDWLLVGALKFVFKRQRPYGTITTALKDYSFPSGHTSRAFLILYLFLVLHFTKHGTPVMTLLSFQWALTVGYARLLTGKHYFSDVVGSVLLGIAEGWIVTESMWVTEEQASVIVETSMVVLSSMMRPMDLLLSKGVTAIFSLVFFAASVDALYNFWIDIPRRRRRRMMAIAH